MYSSGMLYQGYPIPELASLNCKQLALEIRQGANLRRLALVTYLKSSFDYLRL
jgi:hypothetical protein